jgi:hypothetical protein
MNWLREAVSDSSNGCVSSKRVSLLIAAIALGVATLLLAAAAVCGRVIGAELMFAVTAPLSGLCGYGYVNGKKAETERDKKDV